MSDSTHNKPGNGNPLRPERTERHERHEQAPQPEAWKELQDLLETQRHALDVEKAPTAAWEQVAVRLDRHAREAEASPRSRRVRRWLRPLAAAALIAGLGAVAWTLLRPATEPGGGAGEAVAWYSMHPELRDAERELGAQVEVLRTQVEQTLPSDQVASHTAFLGDLDEAYSGLQEDALDTGLTEDVVRAMIANYQLRIRLLEHLLQNWPGQPIAPEQPGSSQNPTDRSSQRSADPSSSLLQV